jgi:hypothetical protein
VLTQAILGKGRERDVAGIAIFGVSQCDDAMGEVDLLAFDQGYF